MCLLTYGNAAIVASLMYMSFLISVAQDTICGGGSCNVNFKSHQYESNRSISIAYSVFCTKCFRLQNVVLPYSSHISLISNYQHWNFAIAAKVSL